MMNSGMDHSITLSSKIFTIREQRILLDVHLAELYGVPTKALNQAVKRKRSRFPPDFMFQLAPGEYDLIQEQAMRSQIVTASKKRNVRHPPFAFTEHGAIMAASVLNSDQAIEMSVFVVRAFIKMREQLSQRVELGARLASIEKSLMGHDSALRDLYQKLRPLLLPPPDPPKKPIGFHAKEARARYRIGRGIKTK